MNKFEFESLPDTGKSSEEMAEELSAMIESTENPTSEDIEEPMEK